MFFWFIGTAVVTIWLVFRDPTFDYRLLIVGSVVPSIVDAAFGGARAMHSLALSVLLLAIVMVATPRRSAIRKMLMGLPLGTLLHLVFTGAWAETRVFWWPFAGLGFGGARHPVVVRGWWNVALEAIGIALCCWVVIRADLRDASARARFWRSGQLALPTV